MIDKKHLNKTVKKTNEWYECELIRLMNSETMSDKLACVIYVTRRSSKLQNKLGISLGQKNYYRQKSFTFAPFKQRKTDNGSICIFTIVSKPFVLPHLY